VDEGADAVRAPVVGTGADSTAPIAALDLARPETVAARDGVLAARATLVEELERLEASARAAVDIKAKVRRNPGKTVGVVAGVGFLALGGPRKVLRGTRNVIFGKPEPLPKSMLPEEIDSVLRSMGDDGARVRGLLERGFADYLRKDRPRPMRLTFVGLRAAVASQVLRVGRERVLPRVVEAVTSADPASFAAQLERVRSRRPGASSGGGAAGTPPGPGPSPKRPSSGW
jgi:hypothetical protein